MDNQLLYWIWLTQRKGLGAAGQRALLEGFGSPAAIWKAEDEALARAGWSEAPRKVLADKDLGPAQAVLQRCRELGIAVLTLWQADYPEALRQVSDAPLVLYCRGQLPPMGSQPWIGVVGARKADSRGLTTARLLGREISACGGVVVTGMAKGVDAEAAWGALDQDRPVVGVLGSGVDVVYPRENAELFARVAEQGCLLSEYLPGAGPNARHFPARNRIISALSDGVVVVQATETSGALITARWAGDQGRDVFAVPGPAGEPLSRGCNQLLRDGAILAETGWDVMREYEYRYPGAVRMQSAKCKMQNEASPVGAAKTSPACRTQQSGGLLGDSSPLSQLACDNWHPQTGGPASRPVEGCRPQKERAAELDLSDLTPVQRQIAEALMDGPLQLDTLIDRSGISASQILPQLTVLQIKKTISQKPGKIYELSGG